VVNVPKFKTHDLTLLTGAVKNLFGLVSGTFKTELHKTYFKKEEFAKILVDIYELVKPSLTVVDAILALEGEGPGSSGTPRPVGAVLAGKDCVAVDAVLAMIMGVEPRDVLTTQIASRRQLGEARPQDITVHGERLESVTGRPFVLPTTSGLRKKLPPFVIDIARQLIKYFPAVDHARCTRCAACVDACPMKVISLKRDFITFDYSGCIACFCCQEACPLSAIRVKKSLFARMVGL
jgi:ferredoxin